MAIKPTQKIAASIGFNLVSMACSTWVAQEGTKQRVMRNIAWWKPVMTKKMATVGLVAIVTLLVGKKLADDGINESLAENSPHVFLR